MGFRTVVMLNNDRSHEWSNDPELGQKILRSMNNTHRDDLFGPRSKHFDGGSVVECVHADTVTVAKLGLYNHFERLGTTSWRHGEGSEEETLRALKNAADEMGYRLVKKPNTKGK